MQSVTHPSRDPASPRHSGTTGRWRQTSGLRRAVRVGLPLLLAAASGAWYVADAARVKHFHLIARESRAVFAPRPDVRGADRPGGAAAPAPAASGSDLTGGLCRWLGEDSSCNR